MNFLAFLRDNARFLAAGALLSFTSAYGQTFFIAIFSARIMAEFHLTDGQWGGIYTLGTTVSAIVMLWAGTLTDRFRVRALAWAVLPAFAVSCVLMSLNTSAIALVALIFALRFFGQGMTSLLAIVAMARWFVARRGLALSVSAMGFYLGQAGLPVLFAFLLRHFDWRSLWLFAALLTLLALPLIAWLLTAERTPSSHGKEETSAGMEGRHWTRPEVLKSPLFWCLVPMLLGPPAWGTALFFQQVHIAEVKGWPLVDYLALIPLLTVVSLIFTFISGNLIDRFGTIRLAQIFLIPFVVGFATIATAQTIPVAALGMVILGTGLGIQSTLPAALWAEFYGTRHLGAIKAASTSIMVFGSALGPGISGVLIDAGYEFPLQMLMYAVYFAAAAALVWIGTERARPNLSTAGEVDVERA